jgi:hypothetical protein
VCSDTGNLFGKKLTPPNVTIACIGPEFKNTDWPLIQSARVQLKANRQLLAMSYSGILGRRPTILANLSPQKGIYSNLAAPTSGRVWNATITLA